MGRAYSDLTSLRARDTLGIARLLRDDARMNASDGLDIVRAASRDEWRAWLAAHHGAESGVWLVINKKASRERGVTYEEAVEEALCFGWIDSKTLRMDERAYRQLFTPRRPKGAWAASNKARVERLIAEGRMTPAGLQVIEAAKADGSWDTLNHIDELRMPDDLFGALVANPTAQHNFNAFPDSAKRMILFWITSAKRAETRAKRIGTTVDLAERNIRADQYRPPADDRKKPAE